jgi:hypothetical protein
VRYEHLPVFGPTDVSADEDTDAVVVVRVAYALSREQLLAALAYGFPEMADGREPADLSNKEVRTEVEGYLGMQGIVELDRIVTHEQGRTYPPEQRAILDALAAAIDRTYLTPHPEPAVQSPLYRDGTVTVQTLDHGEVTVPEPAWCLGHDDEYVGYLADVTHNGARTVAPLVTAKYGLAQIMHAYISHAPHAQQQPEPKPLLSFLLDGHGDLDAADGHNLARALRIAAVRIERMATALGHLRGGQ